jgi:UDP-N-acetylmuramoyl-L-alanyl-D-glutamate--2,6-diaminopimelate ligase
MKLLSDILYKVSISEVIGSTHLAVSSVVFDSRKTERLSLFVAVKGTASDGHEFIQKAIELGATAIVCETLPNRLVDEVCYVKVNNSAQALGIIASNFFDNPSASLKLIGITGTNGKTTSVSLLYKLFTSLGYKCGLISTVRYIIDRKEFDSTHTTPDAVRLNSMLSEMVKAGCTYCFMEVSSHAVVQHRISGLKFHIAGFTNITHDHLDYHLTFDNYLEAKKLFFDNLSGSAIAVVNKDDRNGKIMLQNTRATKYFYSLLADAEFKGKVIESHIHGQLINLNGSDVWVKLSGTFNAYNILLVYAIAVLAGQDKQQVLTALSLLNPVEGRFQMIRGNNNITGIVDYAHTPDALDNVLKTISSIRNGNLQLITIVGCGGDRDKAKRPLMAQIAAKYSDKVILTSDNPRSEKPEDIIQEMEQGLDPVSRNRSISITDRRQAIKTACVMAQAGDIILLAGKGHENYQEISGVRFPFNDYEELTNNLNA